MTHTHSFSSSQISAISGIVRCVCVCVGKRATNTTTTKQTIYQMHRITTVHTIPFVFSCIVHKIYGFYLHAEEVDINWIQARHHSFEPSEMSMYRKKKQSSSCCHIWLLRSWHTRIVFHAYVTCIDFAFVIWYIHIYYIVVLHPQ